MYLTSPGNVVFKVPRDRQFEVSYGQVLGWMTLGGVNDTANLNYYIKQPSSPHLFSTYRFDAVSSVFVGSVFSGIVEMPEWSRTSNRGYMLRAHVSTSSLQTAEFTGKLDKLRQTLLSS